MADILQHNRPHSCSLLPTNWDRPIQMRAPRTDSENREKKGSSNPLAGTRFNP